MKEILRLTASDGCKEIKPCVTRIGESNGKAFVVYLSDGTKITVGRDKTTKGPAWLEISQQAVIKAL